MNKKRNRKTRKIYVVKLCGNFIPDCTECLNILITTKRTRVIELLREMNFDFHIEEFTEDGEFIRSYSAEEMIKSIRERVGS